MQHMCPTSPDVEVCRPRGVSAFVHLANVVLEPKAWARGITADPPWVLAFAGIVVLRLASLLAFYRPATSPGKLLMGVMFQVLTITPSLVVLAWLLWIAAILWRARVSWAVAFSATVHISFAHTLVTIAVASVAGAVLPETVHVDIRYPPFTNLDFLVPADRQPLHAVLGEVDVRSVFAGYLGWLALRASRPNATKARVLMVLGTCSVVLTALEVARATGAR